MHSIIRWAIILAPAIGISVIYWNIVPDAYDGTISRWDFAIVAGLVWSPFLLIAYFLDRHHRKE